MRAIRSFQIVSLVAIVLTTFLSVCLAEIQVITTDATYTMGDGESPSFAEAQVLQKAKQAALEQAGTYVEAYTKTRNFDLTQEEIQTLAGGVLAIQVLEKTRTLVGEGLRFYTKIKATVTTDDMESLAQRIRGKNVAEEYKKLQTEYARLSRELETWKQLAAKMPQGPERDTALDQIREREKAFGVVERKESALFQRLVSSEQLIVSALDEKADIDQLLDFIKERGHVIEMEKIRALPVAEAADSLKLTVPIRLKHASTLPTVLSDVARKLGGDEVSGLPNTHSPKSRTHSYPYGTPTLKVYVPDTLRSKLILRTVPGRPNDLSSSDNRYREAFGKYYITTPASKIRPSRNRAIEEYFYKRISNLILQVELNFTDPTLISERCVVPYLVNRLIPVEENKSGLYETYLINYTVGHPSWTRIDAPANDSTVLLLLAETTFDVELLLSQEMTKKLDRVRAWFDDKENASSNVCNTIVRND